MIHLTRNSDPSLGVDFQSLTPPHEMDDHDLLFPDLHDVVKETIRPKSTVPVSNDNSEDAKVICIKLDPGQEAELESYLQGNLPVAPTVTKKSPTSPLLVTHMPKPSQGMYNPPSPTSSVGTESVSSYISSCRDQYYELKANKCMTKSAIAARENRNRKKQYLDNLENSADRLSKENAKLKSANQSLSTAVSSLRTEVQYLKSVLANESTLSTLLKNIPGVPGIQLRSSEIDSELVETDEKDSDVENVQNNCYKQSGSKSATRGAKRKSQSADHDYASQGNQKRGKTSGNPGVCLHVSGGGVSLEFCATCSNKASQSRA